jgi:hypothetical protein
MASRGDSTTTPTQHQPQAFLEGWCKLPDELKIAILNHCLPRHSTITESFSRLGTGPRGQTDFDAYLLPLLVCPGTACLATEILYCDNTVHIVHGREQMSKCFIPPPNAWQHISQLSLSCQLGRQTLSFLARIGKTLESLQHLKCVDVVIWSRTNPADSVVHSLLATDTETVSIPTLRLKVTYLRIAPMLPSPDIFYPTQWFERNPSMLPVLRPDPLEMLMVGMFYAKTKQTVKQKVLRYYCRDVADESERSTKPVAFVEEWPLEVERIQFYLRATAKIMWA